MAVFDRAAVEAEYTRLGYSNGWSFLATPESTLHSAKVGLIALNPGCDGPGDRHRHEGMWDVPGNAFFDRGSAPDGGFSPTQLQVQKWYELLGLGASDAFCAHFVPFRSPTWPSLRRKQDALAFASSLWSWVFSVSPATLFVTMGKKPAQLASELLNGSHAASLPTCWGSQTIDVWESPSGRRIVAMPHPNRHLLFNRSRGASKLAEANFRLAARANGSAS